MARKMIQIRLSETGIESLDALADTYLLTRADVMRACFSVALGPGQQHLYSKLQQMTEDL